MIICENNSRRKVEMFTHKINVSFKMCCNANCLKKYFLSGIMCFLLNALMQSPNMKRSNKV